MSCGAKTRSGSQCKNAPLKDGAGQRCKLHGGMSLSGVNHPNYKHGQCTKKFRRATAEASARIKLLEQLAINLGMIEF
jgi:hypothetical protein